MVIQAIFSSPENISQSVKPDKFMINLINPQIFVSETSGLSLQNTYNDDPDEAAPALVAIIPKQMPKGVKMTTLKGQASTTSTGLTSIVIIQIIAQFIMKNVMNEMWQLYFTL